MFPPAFKERFHDNLVHGKQHDAHKKNAMDKTLESTLS
jgi:hypothetical protein